MLGASLAGCIAITVEMYAQRKGWDVGAVEVSAEVAYEGHAPASFDVTLRLPGSLTDAQKERLLGVAARCPVHKALAGATHVNVTERQGPA